MIQLLPAVVALLASSPYGVEAQTCNGPACQRPTVQWTTMPTSYAASPQSTQTPQYYSQQAPSYAPAAYQPVLAATYAAPQPQPPVLASPTTWTYQTPYRAAAAPAACYGPACASAQPTYASYNARVQTTGQAGFIQWLNGYRASRGLGPVVYDPALTADAQINNGQQQARGLGHHYMGRARRQNSCYATYEAQVANSWVGSPGHNSALLDPTITRVGYAYNGVYATMSAN